VQGRGGLVGRSRLLAHHLNATFLVGGDADSLTLRIRSLFLPKSGRKLCSNYSYLVIDETGVLSSASAEYSFRVFSIESYLARVQVRQVEGIPRELTRPRLDEVRVGRACE
jgi:hypothetical protein